MYKEYMMTIVDDLLEKVKDNIYITDITVYLMTLLDVSLIEDLA